MSKDLTLYYVYGDDDCHRYLISKCYEASFKIELTSLKDKLWKDVSYDEDDFYSDLENLLEHFEAKGLEGEEYYVVLASDLNLDKFGLTGDNV